MRNQNWSRDETILLMDLYLRAPRAGKTHPEDVALSELLREVARQSRLPFQPTYRNTAGIAMRLRNFGQHDPEAPPERDAGLRLGGAIDAAVWRELGEDHVGLAAEVRRIKMSVARSLRDVSTAQSSRGPVPSFGSRTSDFEDGLTMVYLLLIDAPLALLAPRAAEVPGYGVIKIGRTSNLVRRIGELSSGLPRTAAIHYAPIGVRQFGTAREAHDFEQAMLDLFDKRGWSIGGEFAYAPLADVKAELRAPSAGM